MTDIEKFGQFVHTQRLKKGLTLRELADKFSTRGNYRYLIDLEKGRLTGITFATANKILEALDCEMEFREME